MKRCQAFINYTSSLIAFLLTYEYIWITPKEKSFGGVSVSTGGRSGQWLQAERQLPKLAKILTAKKEDEVFFEAEYALAA